jgi:enterochelin esterase-like enzyme
VERPGYVPPAWLTAPATPGRARPLSVPVSSLDATIDVTLWSPDDDDSDPVPLPLMVVHDGPEYDERAALTHYLAAGITAGWLPRLRAALLNPGVERNHWYSANPDYTDAVSSAVIPALADAVASTVRVGMGTSLGGLAMLHIQRTHPDVFDALYLQSGSFFRPSFDAHERRRLSQYRRIVRFVNDVLQTTAARPVRTVLTCGAAEENVHNNRVMAGALRAQGYDATLHETPGGHDFTTWRDAFDPHLTRLLQERCAHETRRG